MAGRVLDGAPQRLEKGHNCQSETRQERGAGQAAGGTGRDTRRQWFCSELPTVRPANGQTATAVAITQQVPTELEGGDKGSDRKYTSRRQPLQHPIGSRTGRSTWQAPVTVAGG